MTYGTLQKRLTGTHPYQGEVLSLYAFKAFDIDVHDRPRFLFHGVNGKKTVPLDTWVPANVVRGRDGSGQHYYETGFHVLRSLEDVEAWARSLTHPKQVSLVRVRDVRPKPGSSHKAWLANELQLPLSFWAKRFTLTPKMRITADATKGWSLYFCRRCGAPAYAYMYISVAANTWPHKPTGLRIHCQYCAADYTPALRGAP